MGDSKEELKSLLMKVKEKNEKVKIFLGLGTKGSRMKMLDVG